MAKTSKTTKTKETPEEIRKRKNRERYAEKRKKLGLPYRPNGRGRLPLEPSDKAKRKPSFSIAFKPEAYEKVSLAGGPSYIKGLVLKDLGIDPSDA